MGLYYTSNTGKNKMNLYSEEQDDNLDKIAININNTYLIVKPKNEIAQDNFSIWFDEILLSETPIKETLGKLEELIDDESQFLISDNKKEAYSEYLRIERNRTFKVFNQKIPTTSARPNKSADLLKIWFKTEYENRLTQFLKSSIDDTLESQHEFELECIDREIGYVYSTYLKTPIKHKEPDNLLIANRIFVKWLEDRKTNLTASKIDLPLDVLDNYTKRIAWFTAIGVVDFIGDQIKTQSSRSIARVLALGMLDKNGDSLKPDTVKTLIDRMRNPENLKSHNTWIDSHCQKNKIDRIH